MLEYFGLKSKTTGCTPVNSYHFEWTKCIPDFSSVCTHSADCRIQIESLAGEPQAEWVRYFIKSFLFSWIGLVLNFQCAPTLFHFLFKFLSTDKSYSTIYRLPIRSIVDKLIIWIWCEHFVRVILVDLLVFLPFCGVTVIIIGRKLCIEGLNGFFPVYPHSYLKRPDQGKTLVSKGDFLNWVLASREGDLQLKAEACLISICSVKKPYSS